MLDSTAQPTPAPVSLEEYRGWAQLSVIENDRYCQFCGYNLRTQAVRRHPSTALLVTRCPECARFTAVSEPSAALRPWTRRLISMAVFLWLGFLLSVAGWAIGGSVGLHMISLEERLTYTRFQVAAPKAPTAPATPASQPGISPQAQAALTLALQAASQPAGGTVAFQPTRPRFTYNRHIMEKSREYYFIKWMMIGLAALIAFAAATIVLVALPHWPRLAYLAVFCIAPIIPAAIAWLIWNEDKPDFIDWGTIEIGHTWLGQVLAGLLAGLLGRRPMRLMAVVFLPSRLRAALAYLWLVDGYEPPVAKGGARDR